MPKKTLKSLEGTIAELRELRESDRRHCADLNAQVSDIKQRLKEIAADNESLRMDKKWLQQVVRQLITPEANPEGRFNALPR